MPGTFIFKPIEANLVHNTNILERMNPYCTFEIGKKKVKGEICKKGGLHPHWTDTVTLPESNDDSKVCIEVMDKDRISHDDSIGSIVLDLEDIKERGQVKKWCPLRHKNRKAGDILMEIIYNPDKSQAKGKADKDGNLEMSISLKRHSESEQGQTIETVNIFKEDKDIKDQEEVKDISMKEPVESVSFIQAEEPAPLEEKSGGRVVMVKDEVFEPGYLKIADKTEDLVLRKKFSSKTIYESTEFQDPLVNTGPTINEVKEPEIAEPGIAKEENSETLDLMPRVEMLNDLKEDVRACDRLAGIGLNEEDLLSIIRGTRITPH